jgi:hypothetical protein
MGCPNNPKKFWIFRWNGSHDYQHQSISRWGSYSWAKYNVTSWCPRCKTNFGEKHAVEEEILVRLGYDPEKLHTVGDRWSKDAETLKVGYKEEKTNP